MSALWSPEETKKNVIRSINETYIWHRQMNISHKRFDCKAIRESDDIADSALKDALNDVLNMDYSSSKVRLAIQLGVERAGGLTLILGPGGCGKSLIYKTIAHCISHCLCMAPTGVAAYNLASHGWGELIYTKKPTTIHSALGLSARPYFFPTEDDEDRRGEITSIKRKLIGSWRGSSLYTGTTEDIRPYDMILIDEISMVNPNLLDLIITAAGEMNIPIMMFGDPMQLRPVEVSDRDGSNKNAVMLARSYPGWNFFNSYAWMSLQNTGAARTIVLDSVYRQSDPGFKSLLNRMRINEPTEEDWKCLESRKRNDPPEGSLILCKRNNTVNAFNEQFSGKRSFALSLDKKTISECDGTVFAQLKSRFRVTEGKMSRRDEVVFNVLSKVALSDVEKDKKNPKKEVLKYNPAYTYTEKDGSFLEDYSGFSPEISLYPGDRVMVTKNCITESFTDNVGTEKKYGDKFKITGGSLRRIVNGMLGWYLGVVNEKYCENLETGEKPSALILLDTDEVVLVPMMEFSSEKIDSSGHYYTAGSAMQYPIRMAYAITYHKAQGLTLDKVHMILEGDNSTWKVPGLAYLGLSRCTTLEGLTIYGLSRAEFIEDEDSKKFMKHSESVSW